MKKISLTKNKFAIVDNEDYEELNKYKWHFDGRYARRSKRIGKRGDNKQIRYSMHREILGTPKKMETDHINHDKLDNRRKNLRIVTNKQNQYNQKPQKYGTSKYKGVHWNSQQKRWKVQIMFNKKRIYIGVFKNEIKAARAYDKKARELFGEYAYLNFPFTLLPLEVL